MPSLKLEREWRTKMKLYTLKDFIDEDTGKMYTRNKIIEYIEANYKTEGQHAKLNNREYTKIDKFPQEFYKLFNSIPTHWKKTLHRVPLWEGNYSAAARNMMASMNVNPGEGLGQHLQGIRFPIEPSKNFSENREGLGYSNKPRVKIKEDRFRAIVRTNDITYGLLENNALRIHNLNTKGTPVPTNKYIAAHEGELRKVVRWRGRIAGVAESYFPHPKEWRMMHIDKDLDKITVKDLTRAFMERLVKPASCKDFWTQRLGPLPFFEIGKRYTTGVLTPKDYGTHYKCVLHRTFRVRKHDCTAEDKLCRVCGLDEESVRHFGECTGMRPIYSALRVIDGGSHWDQAPLNLLGVTTAGGVIPPGISAIHMCIWKELIIELMKSNFNPHAVISRGAARVKDRLDAFTRTKLNERLTLQAKGKDMDPMALHRKLEGITVIDREGDVMMCPLIIRWLDHFTNNTFNHIG